MKALLLLLPLIGIAAFFLYRSPSRLDIPGLPEFDINRYMGKWYEIARIDNSFERGLERVYAEYAPGEKNRITVANHGYSEKNQKWQTAHAYAVATPVKSHFKVYFFPMVAGNYQVAYVDENYTLALVSGGTPDYLWILSRTPTLTPEKKQQILSLAGTFGYDTAKLHFTHQPVPEAADTKP